MPSVPHLHETPEAPDPGTAAIDQAHGSTFTEDAWVQPCLFVSAPRSAAPQAHDATVAHRVHYGL